MNKFITDITQSIGQTPLLRLDKLAALYKFDGEIYAKLEHLNPSFSKKDRIGLGMIELAEKKDLLKPGQPVVEMTSGNTGTSIALVCAAKGYRFVCVMSAGNSIERVKMIKAFGGEVVLVPQAPDSVKGKVSGADLRLVEIETERIVAETGGCYMNQFNNQDNSLSQEAIVREIWEQTDGAIEVFADFGGTGGTFSGCSNAFKNIDPNIKCYLVEPDGAAYYNGEELNCAGHRIQGGGYAKEMSIVDRSKIDGCITVTDEEAIRLTRELAKVEGIFAGFSSGANVMAAIKLLQGKEKGKKIAICINDCGLKYMSTDLY